MSSLSFLSKKSWHTGLQANQEKVWKAEKAALAERRKVDELRKERDRERELQELERLQAEAGGSSKRLDRVDWMYNAPAGGSHVDKSELEDYLLGKKRVDKLLKGDESSQVSKTSGVPGMQDDTHGLQDPALSDRDMSTKIRQDPMFAIRQQEQAAYQALLKDPAKLKAIRKAAGLDTNESKEERRRRKDEKRRKRDGRSRDSDDVYERRKSRHRETGRSYRDDDRRDARRDDDERRYTLRNDDESRRYRYDDGQSDRYRDDEWRKDRHRDDDVRTSRPHNDGTERRYRDYEQRETFNDGEDARQTRYRDNDYVREQRSRDSDKYSRRDHFDDDRYNRRDKFDDNKYGQRDRPRTRAPYEHNAPSNGVSTGARPPRSRSPASHARNEEEKIAEREAKLAAMQRNATDLHSSRQAYLADVQAKEQADLERDEQLRQKAQQSRPKGFGNDQADFLMQQQQQLYGGSHNMDLAERLRRGRDTLQRFQADD